MCVLRGDASGPFSMCLDWSRVGSNPDFRVGLNPVGVWLEGWVESSFLFG